MARVNVRWSVPEDGMSVTLEMCVDGDPKAHMILDAFGLESLVADLAGVRAQMAEPVTPDLETGMRLQAIADPRWRTEAYHPFGSAALALRHPGYGWLSFLLPPAEARALGSSLVVQAEQLEAKGDPPSSPPSGEVA